MVQIRLLSIAMLISITMAQEYRLPKFYIPSHYELHLTIPSTVFTTEDASDYNGSVSITFSTTQNIGEVQLHASSSYVDVTEITVTSVANGANINIVEQSVDNTTDIITVRFENNVEPGEFVITLVFGGTLSTSDMYGFYKSKYTENGITKYLATTQFEAVYARRAFPCFDEPSYKATFNISLTYPLGLTALGNTEVLGSTNNPTNTTTTVFHTTPIMSTYLVAFIISDFTTTTGNPIEGRLSYQVASRRETANLRTWALEVAPSIIDSINVYTGINYSASLNKLDQVAIPDFSAGAMENWGLITYRERALLYDEIHTSNIYKQYIAAVIAHELAHQWFGNLVTCKWWSEIFLNEGFATLLEYFITDKLHPSWKMNEQFVIKVLQNVFDEDASSSEALRKNVSTPSEISARFGGITYDKGGSILRMVQNILGDTKWAAGINHYLTTYSTGVAEPEDLWNALQGTEIATTLNLPANLSEVMRNWVDYPGYPVLNVTRNGSELFISQQRFVLNSNTSLNSNWYVPITYSTSENIKFTDTTPVAWLTPTISYLTLNISSNVSWIVVNNLQSGYYRVNYDSLLWDALSNALKQANFSSIPDINRAQIVNDAFSLGRGGYISYRNVFKIIEFLEYDTSYITWYPAFNGFEYIIKRVGENTTLGTSILNHVVNLTTTLIASVPLSEINETEHYYTLNQVQAQYWSCKVGNLNCIDSAVSLFNEYKNFSNKPNKNLRSIVYCYGLKHSTNRALDWEFLWNEFLNTSLATEQVTLLAALGCTNDESILNKYLNQTLTDGSGIRSQDYAAAFSAVYKGSPTGVNVALNFFIDNFNSITVRYTSMNGVGNILKGIAEQITTQEQLNKLQTFVLSNALNGTLLESANSATTLAQNNLAWADTYRNELSAYYGLENETTTVPSNVTTTVPSNVTTENPQTTEPSSASKCFITVSFVILSLITFCL